MGRCKLKIEEIKDGKKRASCFRKRAQGILKKVDELAILCKCDLALVIVSENKTVTTFSTKDIDSIVEEARQIQIQAADPYRQVPVVASECPPAPTASFMHQYYDPLNLIRTDDAYNSDLIQQAMIPAINLDQSDVCVQQQQQEIPQMAYPFQSH